MAIDIEPMKMHKGLISPKDTTQYNLFRGVTDFGNLAQIDYAETGYSFLVHLDSPVFLKELARKDAEFDKLLKNYIHIIECEFKGLDGLENLTSETLEISDGIRQINMIGKVNEQASTTVTLNGYKERIGSPITKVHDIYLRGIKDGSTEFKTYHGLIENETLEPSYENEVFKYLYITTDNTGLRIENAYMLLNAQPTTSHLGDISNSTKGDINHIELSIELNCFPVRGPKVTEKAQSILKDLHIVRRTEDMIFKGILN